MKAYDCGLSSVFHRNQCLMNRKLPHIKRPRIKIIYLVLGIILGLVSRAQCSGFCVVGYVSISLTNGYNFINLQFLSQDDPIYTVSKVFRTNAPDGTQVYLWDVTNQVFAPPSV